MFSLSNFKRKPEHGFFKMFLYYLFILKSIQNKHRLSIEAQYFTANYIRLGKN